MRAECKLYSITQKVITIMERKLVRRGVLGNRLTILDMKRDLLTSILTSWPFGEAMIVGYELSAPDPFSLSICPVDISPEHLYR